MQKKKNMHVWSAGHGREGHKRYRPLVRIQGPRKGHIFFSASDVAEASTEHNVCFFVCFSMRCSFIFIHLISL